MKKILGICGDSFMASISKDDNNLENGHGKHFTDILKERLGCEIITYAKGGVSNQCIRLQIDEIIKHNPHHIIIGTTSPDRIEIPLNDLKVIIPLKNGKIIILNLIKDYQIFHIKIV